MENDVLKNKIAPWQEKGRWYHGFLNVITGQPIANKTDSFLNDSSKFVYFFSSRRAFIHSKDTSICLVDAKFKFSKDFTKAGAEMLPLGVYVTTAGGTGLLIGCEGLTGEIEFWVYIVTQ